MSTNVYLVIRLAGGMQSWGGDSQYAYRNSAIYPTKSGVLGLCCAAKGINRGSIEEHKFLELASTYVMTAIAIPKLKYIKDNIKPVSVRRIEDFHTVSNTKTAEGKLKDTLTYRQYLCDAEYLVLLEMPEKDAEDLSGYLENPVWGIWLGRKSCVPSAPVFAGICRSLVEVREKFLFNKQLEEYSYQQETVEFNEGVDTLMDIPVNFAILDRSYRQRRIRIHEAVK